MAGGRGRWMLYEPVTDLVVMDIGGTLDAGLVIGDE